MTAYNFSVTYPDNGVDHWSPGQLYSLTFEYALTGALVAADTITTPASGLPAAGIRIRNVEISYPELDTNASPTGTLNVGDSTDADRFIASALMGRADGGIIYTPINVPQVTGTTGVTSGTNYLYAQGTDPRLIVTVASAVATGATSGLIRLKVDYDCVG